MFIEFQVGNYKSFRDIQRFTMQAAPLRTNDSGDEEGNVFTSSDFRLLKSKAIYGSNASGKSNLVDAFSDFHRMVDKSVVQEEMPKYVWENTFKLITDWDKQPIFFQYIFLSEGVVYRYGFQILNDKIIYEWLFEGDSCKEKEYFMRTPEGININKENFKGTNEFFEQSKKSENELYRSDSLFLTAAAINSNILATKLRDEIRYVAILDGMKDEAAIKFGLDILLNGTEKERIAIKELLKAADTGIEDLELIDEMNFDFDNHHSSKINSPKNSEKIWIKKASTLFSSHLRYDENGKKIDTITVPFGKWESSGTGKFLGLSSVILDSLGKKRALIVDEFDAKLHPNLTLKIVELYHSKDTNPHNAQLIFVTHDTGLLRRAELRRDQICIVNKDKYGISTLRTLIEFKGVRKDASYEKEYLNGNYEGVPNLGEMESVVKENNEEYGL